LKAAIALVREKGPKQHRSREKKVQIWWWQQCPKEEHKKIKVAPAIKAIRICYKIPRYSFLVAVTQWLQHSACSNHLAYSSQQPSKQQPSKVCRNYKNPRQVVNCN